MRDTAFAIIQDYLDPAALMFEGCDQELSDRNDETETFNIALTKRNFEILSNYMAICYLDAILFVQVKCSSHTSLLPISTNMTIRILSAK